MSVVIWKKKLDIDDIQSVEMPIGAEILSVGNQMDVLYLWFLCAPTMAKEERVIEIIGTGSPVIPGGRKFIGTVIMGSTAVWHVFEKV